MVGPDACLQMHMLSLCSRTAPNVDSYILNLKRLCREKGIDPSASWVLTH
jgi:hypothetical protein